MGNILKKKKQNLDTAPKVRHVTPNHLIPDDVEPNDHPNHKFIKNHIKTTKYTIWSFLPKNLFEQFHRFANLYFLFIVLLNWVPEVNAFTKEIAMIPVIFVLAVTAVKDGFEDYRRYKSDKKVNHLPCRVYSRSERRYISKEWKDMLVGDIVHLSCNEVIPADLVIIQTSDQDGIAHIDTANLDGENNLKQRHVLPCLLQGEEFHPTLFTHSIECEHPNMEINKFHGALLTALSERIPISKNNVLLRGCVLRNTDFAEGIVVYAGHETKALLNNRGPRYKRSKVERQINRDVIWCIILLLLMCFLSALGTGLWNAQYDDILAIPFIPYENLSQSSAPYQGFIRFWTYVILYQVVIPLSLYVTIEIVKIGQMYFISQDQHLYHPASNKRVECRALNITEDLGQIEYVFSDKTGTLTENEMVFQRCAIGGVNYSNTKQGVLADQPSVAAAYPDQQAPEVTTPNPALRRMVSSMSLTDVPFDLPEDERRVWDFFLLLAVCNTVVVSLHGHQDKELERQEAMLNRKQGPAVKYNVELLSYRKLLEMDSAGHVHNDSGIDIHSPGTAPSIPRGQHSTQTPPAYQSSWRESRESSFRGMMTRQRDRIKGLFSASPGAAPREPLENEIDSSIEEGCQGSVSDDHDFTDTECSMLSENTMKTKYEAESPDELALVRAACSYGCRLLHHTPGSAILWLPREGEVSVRVLHTLHFDSDRKRMSVIIRHPMTNQLLLLCKGADSAILPNIRSPSEACSESGRLMKETDIALNDFAKEGLRTLVMAKKVLSEEEYQTWAELHNEAESALEHREAKIQESASRIETDLELLGVTGIEDRLQDHVPETIAALRMAGVNVWVLTGDKQETALNIAYSCKLISFDQEMIILNSRNQQATKELLESKLEYLEELCKRREHLSEEHPPDEGQAKNSLIDQVALVVDGKTIGYLQEDKACRDYFLKLAGQCSSVLCCRATPAQKALMVKLVQDKFKKLTLAIGDGANDVNMIQTADIGIGISGKEGMQAVMASDFAVARFHFLQRLMFVHGHWCYDRLARMTLYMFYKNTVFVLLLMWFQIYSGFSGGAQVDDLNLILFNLVFTSIPPVVFGIFDKDVRDTTLMAKPSLYKQGPLDGSYKRHSYFICILDAVWQSLVQFYIPYFAYYDSDVGIWEFGMTSNFSCVLASLLHLCIETRDWNVFHWAGMLLSLLLFFVINLVLTAIPAAVTISPANPYWVYIRTMGTATFWLCTLLVVIVALAPRYLVRSLGGTFHPDPTVLAAMGAKGEDSPVFATWSSGSGRHNDFRQLQEDHVVSNHQRNQRMDQNGQYASPTV